MADEADRRGSRTTQPGEERDRWSLVVAAGLAVFMASIDMSIVNVALPAIEHDLGIAASMTEWVVLAYLLPLAGLALPSGRWLDSVGGRPALLFSLTGFALASVAAGLARTMSFALGPALATLIWAASSYGPGGMRGAVTLATVLSALSVVALLRTRVPVDGSFAGLSGRHVQPTTSVTDS